MRRLMLPADVTLQGRQPVLVSWREPAPEGPAAVPAAGGAAARPRRRPVARVLDRWRYDGRWWEREIHREYLLLELEGGAVAELFREEGAWWVARLSD